MKATHKRGDGPYLDLGDQWNLYTGWDIFPNFSNFYPISFHTNQIAWKLLCIVTGTPHSRSSDYMRCGPEKHYSEHKPLLITWWVYAPLPPPPASFPTKCHHLSKRKREEFKDRFLAINTENCYKDSKDCSFCEKIHFFNRCSIEKRLVYGSDVKWVKLEIRRNLRELKSPCPCQTLVHRRLTIYLPYLCDHRQRVYINKFTPISWRYFTSNSSNTLDAFIFCNRHATI